ncbi:MAG TPA: protein kinase [Candidatus Hydrogenedentes bacterium]|nr:protein kinase [Candidatus Hydrogenedentota bacterium]HPG70318.1 protein kinase [Candidatus Hydrogenedentota bacterium]
MNDSPGARNGSTKSENRLEPGSMLLGRFRLVRQLGRGGLGDVWLAEDVQLNDERIACKILRTELFYDRRAIADMKREVLLTRRLRHPNILGVYSFWETSEHRLITMEYVEGRSLLDALLANRVPFTLSEILPWVKDLCDALTYAHNQGILHRDVKPGNILLGDDGVVHLADFGIARTAQEVQIRFTGEMTSGTLLFMSPEQLLGKHVDARSDLYSLAATVYELLTGAPPFYEGSIITQIQMKPVQPIEGIGDSVNDVLLKALSKSPGQRQASCAEFCRELSAAAEHWYAEQPRESASQARLRLTISGVSWDPDGETVRLHTSGVEVEQSRVGMLLVDAGIITRAQLDEALRIQQPTEDKLGSVLVRLGYVAEEVIAEAVGEQLQVRYVDLDREVCDPELTALVAGEVARRRRCLPVRREGDEIIVAMADPLDLGTLNEVERLCKARVEIRIAPESALMAAIDRVYGSERPGTVPGSPRNG